MGATGIRFTKMTGAGNDFIFMDNRARVIDPDNCREFVRMACRHKLSVGADGVMLIENDPEVDFRWRFFNADGSEAEMCGNGARCAARFAFLHGIAGERMRFRTLAGIIGAELRGERVEVTVTAPGPVTPDVRVGAEGREFVCDTVNTGVPHVVVFLRDAAEVESLDVVRWGGLLRRHAHFAPAGTNVNFAAPVSGGGFRVRTFERGVEDETLACGTGCIATALCAAARGLAQSPVALRTSGGEVLAVAFNRGEAGRFTDVRLDGGARVVYEAELWDDTLSA